MVQTVKPVRLDPRTLEPFNAYTHQAQTEMEQTLHRNRPFLWSQQLPERAQNVARGRVVAQLWSGHRLDKVASGLIHDWIAAARIANSSIQEVFAELLDYDKHQHVHERELI